MNQAKQKLLDEAFERVMQVCIYDMTAPLEWIDQYISPAVTGFGTEFDEEIHNLEDCRRLVLKAREQSAGLHFKATGQVIHQHISPGEDEVFYVQQIQVQLTVGGELMKRDLRMSLIMEFENGKWMMTHFHGSAPDTGTTIDDTFHVDQWKTKMAELEKLVAEKTTDLALRNRELEIESSLERVRAVAMGMKEPADMLDMCKVIAEELKRLSIGGIKLVETIVIKENSDFFLDYEYYNDSEYRIVETFRYRENELIRQMVDTILQSEDSFYYGGKIEGAPKADWFAFMQNSGYYVAPELLAANEVHYHFYSVGQAALGLVTDHALSDDEFQLYKRLRNVFALAYRRYRDIEKAEEQAREAQVQLALERIRARAMAMQKADELLEVIAVVSEQLENLGLFFSHANFRINEGEKDWDLWSHFKWIGSPVRWQVKYIDHPFFNRSCNNPEETIVQQVFTKEETVAVEQYLFEQGVISMPEDPEGKKIMQKYLEEGVGFAWSVYRIKNLSLAVANHHAKPYTEEENDIIKRFTIVFVQAYSRFLDLQKAEAQAREAQIEAALERVRSRAMAMQQPDELKEVAELLRKEMGMLGVEELETSSVYLVHEENTECWYALKDVRQENTKRISDHMLITLGDTWVGREMEKFYKSNESQVSILMKGENRKEWINYCAEKSASLKGYYGSDIPDRTYHLVKFTGGFMGAAALGAISKESQDLLVRATNVFSLAYTRFKDLLDAAARTKETRIELALERVRSRSMAMHTSDELSEVVATVFQQLNQFLFSTDGGVTIVTEFKAYEYADMWVAADTLDKPRLVRFPHTENPIPSDFTTEKLKGTPLYSRRYDGPVINECWQLYFEMGLYKDFPVETKQWFLSREVEHFTVAFEEHSAITVATYVDQPPTEEQKTILQRFAKVFEQSYIRFLDLQKAEAQSREAQIELGLERVRAKAMAMQHSEELKDLIDTVFTELTKLDIVLTRCLLMIFDPATKGSWWWMANSETQNEPIGLFVKYHEHPPYMAYLEAWETRTIRWQYNLQGQVKKDWDEFLFSQTELSHLPGFVIAGMKAPDKVILSASFNNFGNLTLATLEPLSEEHNDILLRFAKVFDLTYTRFNDLQKAERQARESQIQLALERIRASAMAMQKSDELNEVIKVVLKQMQALGISMSNRSAIINTFEPGVKEFHQWVASPEHDATVYLFTPYFENPILTDLWNARQAGMPFYSISYSVAEKNNFFGYLFENTDLKNMPEKERQWLLSNQYYELTFAFESRSAIALANFSDTAISEDIKEIMKRVAKVFEQAYIRFMDLQKAEKQAREAEIQLALERVRARTMAMQKSDELAEAAALLFHQVKALGIATYTSGFTIWDNDRNELVSWMCNADGSVNPPFRMPIFENEWNRQQFESWNKGEEYIVHDFSGAEMQEYYAYLRSFPLLDESFRKSESSGVPTPGRQVHNAFNFTHGNLLFITTEPDSAAYPIFKRFAYTFEQTYTRFLDLQKAEAQAREAQIENALEKVRSRSLAMHKSEEIMEVVYSLADRLSELGIQRDAVTILIFHASATEYWIANNNATYSTKFITRPESEINSAIASDFVTNQPIGKAFVKCYSLEEKNQHWSWLMENSDFKNLPEERRRFILEQSCYNISVAFSGQISVCLLRYYETGYTNDENQIVQRFANVFSQAYTRFTDLQKAEAQAKESQIQLALERVRARTMAMQKSDELPETSQLLFQQMQAFGETAVQNSIVIVNEEEGLVELSTTVRGNLVPKTIQVPVDDPHVMAKAVAAWKAKQKSLTIQIQGQELKEYNELRNRFLEAAINFPEDNWVVNIAFFSRGWLSFSANHPMSEAAVAVLERFAAVFEQTYTRFLDLQRAEQQAREAEIQLSLERVRARTMAMQRSEELTDTVKLLFEEFKNLHSEKDPLILSRGFITIVNEPEQRFDLWITDIDGSEIRQFFRIDFDEPTQGKHIYKAWKEKQSYIIRDMSGDELTQWLDYLSGVGFPVAPGIYGTRRVNNFIYHSNGFIGITSSSPLSMGGIGLLERFARVFDLTYTRFTDLLQSETRAKQAVKDASLDRVRAEIASMRTTEDLQRITPVIWRELTSLSIPFIRCGVFIMDEGSEQMHCFLSTPEGKSIASFELPFAGEGNLSEVLLHWRKTQRYVAHWQQQDFAGIAATLLQQGRIENEKQYINTLPKDGIHLHFLPFLQGMLYVGNTERLSDNELDLVQSLAESFSTAYARYEDFNRLEAAKKEVEQTLTELKQAQQQLVQSEKMASLGELTAGIAHEIQNPLNFVNNFSEVSNELIDEMKEELATGNYEVAVEIADDVKENLSKINHHGKRADAIVKGMLQHSRTSSGQKESTDLNVLCDEYLRLAYHGYRAKDKSFNAQFETHFDASLPKVKVMSQDIGRVVLNLINNAFYAVNEKAKTQQSANPPSADSLPYQPKVTVSTKYADNKIEIAIEDNGNGIPKKIIDKIFQPFFTTKPTGQGTGLGLSLSYDIVKAHGGDLKVETEEGKGTTFVILLPV